MENSTTLIVAMAAAFFGIAETSHADSYCGAGRHVGAENDGVGQSWLCVPDRARPSLPTIAGGGGNPGSALGNAAAGLQGLAALLSIVSELGSRISPTDATGPVRDYDAEKAAAAIRSRDLNREAIAALQAGQFDRAADLFNQAAFQNLQAENREEYDANMKNSRIANAENMLKRGYQLEQQGDLAAASEYYMRGKQAAQAADETDLAARLSAYNDRLVTQAGGANAGVKPTQSTCSRINGTLLCH